MGASSSGLLDEAKMSHIKGLVDSKFQSFSEFYRQQYSPAYFGHLHQEVEPKKEGCGLLLTQRPHYAPDEVLYQGNVRFSCWSEQGKKCRERYVVLKRDYKVEIHENMESFNHKGAAKLVLQPAGGSVLITEEESRAHLEQICAGVLNGAKDDSSSSVMSSPDVPAVYLHLPYTGYTCFLFQQEEERDHFLSAIKSCIRHCNLDPWSESTYESQAYIRALRLYRQDKGCYESWEMLLGSEEQVLASQVMEEVLPWLQSQLQSRVKGKKAERMRQWLATVHATYTAVLAQLTASLDALKEKCRQTALANQTLIRSNLDQIVSSLSFLEEKLRVCICDEAEGVYNESVAPYLSSIFEVLRENISAGIQGMQHTLHTQMESVFTRTEGNEETNQVLLTLRSISLEQCYGKVKNLTEILGDLQQRFGLSSTQRLVHSAHLEMEQLADSAVYTLELFLKSSAKLQSSQVLVKMERAKDRVFKQLDYDSRLVQRRLYREALLEITLPVLARRMDGRWKNELQQFEQYIFSDYSSFMLIQNVYDDVLRDILSAQIESVIQDAANKKSNNLLLDISDLAISQYSLLGQTPPCSAPGSPTTHARNVSPAGASERQQSAPEVEKELQMVTAHPQTDPELHSEAKSDHSTTQGSDQNMVPLSPTIVVTQMFDEPTHPQTDPELHSEAKSDHSNTQGSDQNMAPLSPTIVVTQEFDQPANEEASPSEEINNYVQHGSDTPSMSDSSTADPETPDLSAVPESANHIPDSLESSVCSLPSTQSSVVPVQWTQSDQYASSDQISEEDAASVQPFCPSPPSDTDSLTKISLESLNQRISCNTTTTQAMAQQTTDRAVYLTGQIRDSWEAERLKEENCSEAEKTTDDEGGAEEQRGESAGKAQEVEEQCLQKPKQMESQSEGSAELPLDSVAVIRELVTEITEVETVLRPCPDSSNSH